MHNAEVEVKVKNNLRVQEIFMEMMIDLFGNTIYYVDHEINQFRTDEFMERVQSTDLPFYLKVIKSYMFKRFVEDRLRRNEDAFSRVVEMKRRRPGAGAIKGRRTFGKVRSVGDVLIAPQINRTANSRTSEVSRLPSGWANTEMDGSPLGFTPRPLSRRKMEESENGEIMKGLRNCMSVNLPTFPVLGTNFDPGHFYGRCVGVATETMKKLSGLEEACTDPPCVGRCGASVRSACLMMRGLYRIAQGELLEGLEDLHAIEQVDYRMFQEKQIKKVFHVLSPHQLEILREKPFYKGDEFYGNSEAKSRNESLYYNDDDLPYNPLDRATFSHILEKSDVTSNSDVINQLFEALSTGSDEVDPEIFASFYHTWIQARHDGENALRSLLSASSSHIGILQDSERLLKVSTVVTSSKGSGRLILTTRKLLFFTELYQECKHIMRLHQITDTKLSKPNFRSSLNLSIKSDDNPSFKVRLKSECELWKNLITEMKTGKMLSRDWKDHAMTLNSAAQNVAIADALYLASQDEGFMTVDAAMTWVKKLCIFTKLHQSGQVRVVPLETDEMLLLRLDMHPKETKKSIISCVQYTSAAIDEIPRVWVALGSRRIRLIDTTQWVLDPRPIKDCSAVLNALCVVRAGEVWAGGKDKHIYAIRTETMKKSRVLHKHSSPVQSIFVCGRVIVSSSSGGEVIVWNKELTKPEKTFQATQPPQSMISASSLGDDVICCCTSSFVGLFTLEGEQRQRLSITEFYSSSFCESHITCCLSHESEQVWVGGSRGSVYLWQRKNLANGRSGPNLEPLLGDRFHRLVPKCTGLLFDIDSEIAITCICVCGKNVWVGSSIGDIIILDRETLSQDRVLKAHDASVTSLCIVENRYMISGSASKDGKIAVWRMISYDAEGRSE